MALGDPRLRALLRQADRAAASGKRAAARQLYEEILDEAPQSVEALLGLAGVAREETEQQALYEQVLELEPENEIATVALSDGSGPEASGAPDSPPVQPVEVVAVPSEVVEVTPADAVEVPPLLPEAYGETETLVCYRHPDRPTGLRCYTCGRPICMKCAKRTPVGYRCPECIREAQDVFFTARPLDYVVAAVVTLILGLLAGSIVPRLGFFVIFLAPAVGTGIGRLAFRAAGRRRGRWLAQLVAAMVVVGGLLPFLPMLLSGISLFGLLWPGLYLFLATGAAYYQVR
ncbi:MAG: hypothetical protein RRC07_15560 [Anaerolineae bacterium]|nr:hypothetical protein [Anaerolineae bacterium]